MEKGMLQKYAQTISRKIKSGVTTAKVRPMWESCRYKKRDTIKAEEKDSSLVFKINDRPQRTVESKRIMVDTGSTSHIIKDIERFKNFDDLFQPDNHFIELADGSKMNWVALKRGDAEICLVNANGNKESVTLRAALFIPSYPQDMLKRG